MTDLGPHRDARDATIERLREELEVAKDTSTKLARMAAKKTMPPVPLHRRRWMLPVVALGAVVGPSAVLICVTTAYHAAFQWLGMDSANAWILASLVTFISCVAAVPLIAAYLNWAERQRHHD